MLLGRLSVLGLPLLFLFCPPSTEGPAKGRKAFLSAMNCIYRYFLEHSFGSKKEATYLFCMTQEQSEHRIQAQIELFFFKQTLLGITISHRITLTLPPFTLPVTGPSSRPQSGSSGSSLLFLFDMAAFP